MSQILLLKYQEKIQQLISADFDKRNDVYYKFLIRIIIYEFKKHNLTYNDITRLLTYTSHMILIPENQLNVNLTQEEQLLFWYKQNYVSESEYNKLKTCFKQMLDANYFDLCESLKHRPYRYPISLHKIEYILTNDIINLYVNNILPNKSEKDKLFDEFEFQVDLYEILTGIKTNKWLRQISKVFDNDIVKFTCRIHSNCDDKDSNDVTTLIKTRISQFIENIMLKYTF